MDFEDFMLRALGVILLLVMVVFVAVVVMLVVSYFSSPESVDVCQHCGAVLGGAVG